MNHGAWLSLCAMLAAGCSQLRTSTDASDYAARMNALGERYVRCMSAEAEKTLGGAAGAEDIAIAAQGRCWSAWSAYRKATKTAFLYGANTPAEVQLASDKADAHLRQFELETRRTLIDGLVQRALQGEKTGR
jgi:hypothetical protein